jgi:NADPH:quinone reductase-like Zn-dependent oxidoreductase
MKAAQINGYGGPEVLQTTTDAPKPKPGIAQVLVEVYAAAVNPFDLKVREGVMGDSLHFPATLGGDVAGIVAELGEGVSGFTVGQPVFGQANAARGQGSYAEFTPVKADSLAAKPESIDFVTAAAAPLTAVSAYQALVEHAGLMSGQKVLIHGAAGGIGSFAVQLAKHLGAYIAATAGTEDIGYVKSLGADEVIDYKTQDFASLLKDYDVVFDTVGGETFAKSHQVLKPGGIIVSMATQPDEALAKQYNVQTMHQATQVNPERLVKIIELVEQGALKVHVDKVFPLEQAGDAQAYLQAGKHHGKVVLKVK